MLPFHWVELLVYGSRIKKHKLEHPPVIILGHWRSGTTYLQRLLCAHNHTAYLTQYEALLPLGTSIHSFVFRPVVQFFFSAFKMQHPAHQLPMTVDFPSEEDIALIAAGFPYTAMWGHIYSNEAIPFFEKYLILKDGSKEQKSFLNFYSYLANRIGYFNKGKHLVLKTPANTTRIKELIQLYPDAKFIYISRDKEEVYHSTIKLLQNNKIHWLQAMSREQMDEVFDYGYKHTLEEYERTKSLIPSSNLIELSMKEQIDSPVAVLKKLYPFLNWDVTAEQKDDLSKFLRKNHRRK